MNYWSTLWLCVIVLTVVWVTVDLIKGSIARARRDMATDAAIRGLRDEVERLEGMLIESKKHGPVDGPNGAGP